ncbi:MAG TPA: sulfotransferase [Solirubrobacteraceae bacterium]|jgi:hypothetical protein
MTASAEAPAVPRESRRRLPDFFIVGHPKCGTTALYQMLRSHPQIYMPDAKETRFFAPELHPGSHASRLHPETIEQYLALFQDAEDLQRAGEASPSYLRSHTAAARIAELAPDARIIAILREPADFLRSLHMELLRDHVEPEPDLAKAIALEEARSSEQARREAPGLVYSDYVHYADQLRRYRDAFGAERVLVLIYDDFRDDNEATVRRVLQFLGVDAQASFQSSDANPSVRVRSLRMYELARSLYMGRGPVARVLKAAVKALTPKRLRRDALLTFRRNVLLTKPRPADEQLTLQLRRRFKAEVVELSKYLDRDLVALWGYDRIG